ncbi:uncharacterized protein BDR25DRAFT_355435 [Lindgomyces ingoldianus]|uniref:Uncharacterized protein n=1 Tax=Lindgomyces ingoldianus TaxID=673940 RepID=A0ACB6QTI5_9PLEO|nr:uncharacterized protein BDR25DRAFT_355435 [Lindgomyces ingoldianus]KAF2470319.1 hypothetical protein BDR25DRAFT_355435 [Lindgomyces ingoldianus]
MFLIGASGTHPAAAPPPPTDPGVRAVSWVEEAWQLVTWQLSYPSETSAQENFTLQLRRVGSVFRGSNEGWSVEMAEHFVAKRVVPNLCRCQAFTIRAVSSENAAPATAPIAQEVTSCSSRVPSSGTGPTATASHDANTKRPINYIIRSGRTHSVGGPYNVASFGPPTLDNFSERLGHRFCNAYCAQPAERSSPFHRFKGSVPLEEEEEEEEDVHAVRLPSRFMVLNSGAINDKIATDYGNDIESDPLISGLISEQPMWALTKSYRARKRLIAFHSPPLPRRTEGNTGEVNYSVSRKETGRASSTSNRSYAKRSIPPSPIKLTSSPTLDEVRAFDGKRKSISEQFHEQCPGSKKACKKNKIISRGGGTAAVMIQISARPKDPNQRRVRYKGVDISTHGEAPNDYVDSGSTGRKLEVNPRSNKSARRRETYDTDITDGMILKDRRKTKGRNKVPENLSQTVKSIISVWTAVDIEEEGDDLDAESVIAVRPVLEA